MFLLRFILCLRFVPDWVCCVAHAHISHMLLHWNWGDHMITPESKKQPEGHMDPRRLYVNMIKTERNKAKHWAPAHFFPLATSVITIYLTHCPLENLHEILDMLFQTDFSDWWLRHPLWNCPNMNIIQHWCHQAISHYLSQCWLRSLLPYGVTRPQWVKPSHSN